MVEEAAGHMERTGVRLLWGTANLFSHPRYAAGAATNPDPEVFAYAAAQVCAALEATHRLGGENYVLWGGREGYDTLLNTDLAAELDQLARFLHLVVEHKHRIGFEGTILIEPKPAEPAKHQYDHDAATVAGFLARHGLEEVKVNLEANHATLAGHSFHHEVATAIALGVFGSVDANRGDPQNGWDTDQFPSSVEEMSLALYEILRAGGLTTGGFNFDTKLRRQSIARDDLFHGHVGAMDTLARALLVAASLLESGDLEGPHPDALRGLARATSAPRSARVTGRSTTCTSLVRDRASSRRRCRAGRSSWRTSSTATSSGPASRADAPRHGGRQLDPGDEGRGPRRRLRRVGRLGTRPAPGRAAARAASRSRRRGGTGSRQARGRGRRARGRGDLGRRPAARDGRCSTTGVGSSARRSSGTTPSRRPRPLGMVAELGAEAWADG